MSERLVMCVPATLLARRPAQRAVSLRVAWTPSNVAAAFNRCETRDFAAGCERSSGLSELELADPAIHPCSRDAQQSAYCKLILLFILQ
jgi:hypothetical protein